MMKLSKNSILYNDKARIILEFFVIFAVLVVMLVFVFAAQLFGDTNTSQEDAQTIYNHLTEALGESSSTTIDNLLSISFDEETSHLYVTAVSGNQLVDFACPVSSDSLIAYLPSLLEDGFEDDLSITWSLLPINTEASLTPSDNIASINYRVATYGLEYRLSGTYLSTEGVYSSIYQRDYNLVTNTWGGNGVVSSCSESDSATLFTLYQLIVSD